MKKEDFKENQLVVQVDDEGKRRPSLFTVVEVHDSHLVVMHSLYGLDAVFYKKPRIHYAPATREELSEAQLLVLQGIREDQAELDRKVAKAKKLQDAIKKLDEANR